MTQRVMKLFPGFLLGFGLAGCTDDAAMVSDFQNDQADAERRHHKVDRLRDRLDDHGVLPLEAPPTPSSALFDLGQALIFDPILSGGEDIACLTCHHPSLGSDDDRALPLGAGGVGLGLDRVGGEVIPRNAPELFNRHAMEVMFWDGRVEADGSGGFDTPAGAQVTPEMEAVFTYGALAAQAMFPVTSREEMRGQVGESELGDIPDGDNTAIWQALMVRLGGVPEYITLFEAAYPGTSFDDMSFAHAANAMGAFEAEAFQSLGSPFQQFLEGDDDALSNRELKGGIQFFDAGCGSCHNGPLLSDLGFHNTGLAQFGPGKGDGPSGHDDFGRERVTGHAADRYAFRTPSLFNVEITGPYGHVGQFGELDEFVDHYIYVDEKLEDYDIEEHCIDPDLHDTQLDNIDDVLDNIDPDAEAGTYRRSFKRKVTSFLESLTDPDAHDLEHLVPESVPSGLPLD